MAVPLATMMGLVLNLPSAWAHKNNTVSEIYFSSPVVDGTPAMITGAVHYDGTYGNGGVNGHSPSFVNGDPSSSGSVQIQQLHLNGNPVACDTPGAVYVTIAQGLLANDPGEFSTIFQTTGLGGQTIGFRAHHPATGGPHGDSESKSDCFDLQINLALDPLPDGSTSYTQGFFGSSPVGEAVVQYLMDETTCTYINYALEKAGVAGTPYGCYTTLPSMLTGTVGPGKDNGFLPSGYAPGQNMASQLITVLLNMNLAYVLPNGLIPIYGSYYINIDVVEDLFGDPPVSSVPPTYVDPILNIAALGTCTDANADMACDSGTVTLTPFGSKITALDVAGTTVQDILEGAYALLDSGDTTVLVNGVMLTKGDLTQILGLINEAFDEGVATGFVTAFDAD